jgi:hypothetical protein
LVERACEYQQGRRQPLDRVPGLRHRRARPGDDGESAGAPYRSREVVERVGCESGDRGDPVTVEWRHRCFERVRIARTRVERRAVQPARELVAHEECEHRVVRTRPHCQVTVGEACRFRGAGIQHPHLPLAARLAQALDRVGVAGRLPVGDDGVRAHEEQQLGVRACMRNERRGPRHQPGDERLGRGVDRHVAVAVRRPQERLQPPGRPVRRGVLVATTAEEESDRIGAVAGGDVGEHAHEIVDALAPRGFDKRAVASHEALPEATCVVVHGGQGAALRARVATRQGMFGIALGFDDTVAVGGHEEAARRDADATERAVRRRRAHRR